MFQFNRNQFDIVHVKLSTETECMNWLKDFTDVKDGRRKLDKEMGNSEHLYGNFEKIFMGENVLYDSFGDTYPFDVTIEPTDLSKAHALDGEFKFNVSTRNCSLYSGDSAIHKFTWPFSYLRRTGFNEHFFIMEPGRRSESGAGVLKFKTPQAKVCTF